MKVVEGRLILDLMISVCEIVCVCVFVPGGKSLWCVAYVWPC